jgi:hypothetical protein
MKKFFLLFCIVLFALSNTKAQLPKGSVAPEWTLTDLNGTNHICIHILKINRNLMEITLNK